MKLYEILQLEGSSKSSWVGISTLAVAENAEAIAKHINKSHDLFTKYTYDEETGEESDEPEFCQETYDEVMENCGDLESEDGWEDSYYGVTKYGWKEISCHINPTEGETLKNLNVKLIEIK